MATLVPRYTAEEVRNFPDDGLRYEVIRGELFVSPAPGTPHQRAVGELFLLLHPYVDRHGLGEVILSPFEVEFAEDTAVQPDLLVVPPERASRLKEERLYGAPSLAIEIISYSSKRTDRLQKRDLYLTEDVDEYWIMDPGLRRVERWPKGATEPQLITDRLVWQPRPGVPPLSIDLKALFERLWRGLK
jgi:Uma2 family endonuclease